MMSSETADSLIEVLREQCLTRGCNGIKGLSVIFRAMDIDYSKRIVYEELKVALERFGILISESYLHTLFDALDLNKSGGIDFCEFMHKLRPPMKQCRIDVIDEAFERLDVNKDEAIMLDDLQVVYSTNAKQHPKFISGEWTEEQVLRNFLDSIDTPGNPDGKVTREEFMNYYAGVSSTVEDDCYFDLMMRACYGLPNRGS
ncbi:calcyphosin-like protein isoform X2 [Mercenaria mercenaria]|uniref:calcyphosin-like protein isoform X2 n=1 Tax=Mercenaria mercenaria TaxID=6596 RepID=UPI00234F85A0|nr:calcyphosin-like protein isoform X2 [Mercenaria mercenaria]